MSDATWEAVQEAIKTHIAEEDDGAYLTQWVVVAHAISAENSNYSYYKYMGHEGPTHEKVGLLVQALDRFKVSAQRDE